MNRIALVILALSLPLVGCMNNGFNAAKLDGAAAQGNPNPTPTPSPNTKNTIATIAGELSWDSITLGNQDIELSYELKIPYGRVYKAASKVVRWIAPYSCQPFDEIKKELPDAYADGEIPCGKILNEQWKELVTLNVDPFSDKKDGFKVTVEGFTLPVHISRSTRSGNYLEANLDQKAIVAQLSSQRFADDISLRWIPNGTTTQMEVCLNLPGMSVTSANRNIKAKAKKSVLGVDISYSSDFKVSPGTASWNYGRGCFAMKYGWVDETTTPTLELLTTQAPYLDNVTYRGLDVDIKDWFLKLVSNIMGFFNNSIEDAIKENLTETANDLADKDVESGRWFTKIHADDLLTEQGQKVNSRVMKLVKRVGAPMTSTDVKDLIHDNCRLLKISKSEKWTDRLNTFCRDLVDGLEVHVSPFAVDESSKAAGCYDYFANIHATRDANGQKKWWADQCKFGAKFKVKISGALQDYAIEVQELIKEQIAENRIPANWQQAIDQLDIDADTLNLVLEELEKRGIEELKDSDWADLVPQILNEIKAQLNN